MIAPPRPRVRFYRRVLRYFRPDASRIALLLVLIGVSTLLGLLQVWPLAILVDTVLARTSQPPRWAAWLLPAGLSDSRAAQIAVLAAATLLLRLVQEALNFWRSILTLHVNNHGLLRARCDLFRKLQALNLYYHRMQPQGDAIYRLSTDTLGCQAILGVAIEAGVAALTLSVMLGIMLSRSLELTLIALGVVPLLLATNIAFGRILKRLSTGAKERESEFTSTLQRSIASISLMQAFGREAAEFGRFRNTINSNNDAWLRFHWIFAWYKLCVALIFGASGALIFGYGGWLVYRAPFVAAGAGGMSVGDLVVFLSYLAMFYEPLCKITGAAANIQGGVVGMERVFEVLDHDPVVKDAPDAIRLELKPRTLELKNVGFSYPTSVRDSRRGRPVLGDMDVTLRPGEMAAFVGPSGVGKSTLLNLLPRFFDPTDGSLELDGIDLRRVRIKDVRKHVALVLQESVILPTTVAENIAYGRAGATEEQIQCAARMAGAHEFIAAMPEGYDTRIAEGGQNLSGGQRQRLAIARALLTEAPFIVLDEPTSALDPHHERLIADTLRNLKGLRTIILVSHRLSTVVDCDRIYMMAGGRIVEQGTHEELVARRGAYYDMARHQLPIGEPEPATELAAA